MKGLGRRLSRRKSERERSSTSLSPLKNKSNRSLTASLAASKNLSERSIGGKSLEELHNLQEELLEAQAELKQFMSSKSRATTSASATASSNVNVNVNVHLLHEKIMIFERERSEMKSIVAEVILQLEGLSNSKEEEGKEVDLLLLPELESDNVFAIYERLKTAVGFIHPLKEYVLATHAQKKDLKADLSILENEHRMEVTLMAQERRRAADALHFKENAMTRLKEQVEALESEVKEAQQLAQAHTLNRQALAIRDTHNDNSSIASFSMDGSMMDDSTFSNVREKMRKKRESATRFLSRFQTSPERRKIRSKSPILGLTVSPILGLTVNNPMSDYADDGDTCSVLSTNESITDTMSQSAGMLSLGGGSKGGTNESKTDDEDDDGMSYVIPNFAQFPSSSSTTSRPCSPAAGRTILKRDPHELIPVDIRRKSWKKLPVPDLEKIGSSTRSVTSCCTESSRVYDDDDMSLSSQSLSVSLAGGSAPRNPTRIRFESVQIRLYHQTLGDNPAVTYGPPIALDWEYDEMSPVKVDEYERTRGDRMSDSNKLFLSSMDRRRVLKNKGFTEEEIDQASIDAEQAKKERALTNALLPAMKVEEVLQSTRRKVKRLLKKSKKEKDKDIPTPKKSNMTDASKTISTLPPTMMISL